MCIRLWHRPFIAGAYKLLKECIKGRVAKELKAD